MHASTPSKGLFARMEPYLYLLPILLVFGVFVYYPLVRTGAMSLSVVNSMGEIVRFSGLANFRQLFASDSFWNSLFKTLLFAVLIVPMEMFFGVVLALLADNRQRSSSPIRVVFALPMAVSSACASIIWMLLFNPTTGLVNQLLHIRINWMASDGSAMAMLVICTCWLACGTNFLYSFSGLQSISQDLYECASLEGANYMQIIAHITLPNLTPTLFFLFITDTIGAFQTFTQVKLMTQGGPGGATSVLAYSIYREAFLNNRWGYACAQSMVFLLILLSVSSIQFRLEKKKVHYQ